MSEPDTTVLAVLDGTETDSVVAKQAERIAIRSGGKVVLLDAMPLVETTIRRTDGVQRIEPWEQMEAKEAAAERRLTSLRRALAVPATVEVRFGDFVEIVAAETAALGADVVVAPPRRKELLPWRRVDRKLLAAVSVPVVFADGTMPPRDPDGREDNPAA